MLSEFTTPFVNNSQKETSEDDPRKYLANSVVVTENDTGVKVVTSTLTDFKLGIEKTIPDLDSVETIVDQIEYVCAKSRYSSKYAGVDEFTSKVYKEDSSDSENSDNDNPYDKATDILTHKKKIGTLTTNIIPGCGNYVVFPRGSVMYHTHNQILFDCLSIQFILNNRCIPLKYTSLDINRHYKILRSDGNTHNSVIYKNYSLRISSSFDRFIIDQHFNSNRSDPTLGCNFPDTDFRKSVIFEVFLYENEIKEVSIKIPYINVDNYEFVELDRDLLRDVAKYYNNKIDEHLKLIKLYFNDIGVVSIVNDVLTLTID